jgi:tripartite-type tricarboxylate transporter receptor subunit TctC
MSKHRVSWIRGSLPVATIISAALLFTFATGVAVADDNYPSRPVHVIVPFSAGGPNDFMARPVSHALSTILGQNFLVENKPGADGTVGTSVVARSAPDGYTMLITTGSFSANAVLRKNLPYDPMKDFRPVTQIAESYGLVMVARAGFEANNLEDAIALIKKKPGKYTFATSGIGNATDVAGKLFAKAIGTEMVAVAYKGSGPALIDVLSGNVDFAFFSTTIAVPQIKSGKLKAFASTGTERVPALPTTPTLNEKGYKDVVVIGYYGMWFPAGVSDAIVEKVNKAAVKAIATPEVASFIKRTDLKAVGSTPQGFAAYLKDDIAWQEKAMKLTGMKKR